MIKEGTNPYFVRELESGYVVLGDFQFYEGYTLLLSKKHVSELHEMPATFKNRFLEEMSLVAEAVYNAFKPVKLNYELLGNLVSHCHWHIFPRYANDFQPKKPIWVIDETIRRAEHTRPSPEKLDALKKSLERELEKAITKEKTVA